MSDRETENIKEKKVTVEWWGKESDSPDTLQEWLVPIARTAKVRRKTEEACIR